MHRTSRKSKAPAGGNFSDLMLIEEKQRRLHMVLLVIGLRFHLHQIDLICKVAKEKLVETLAQELCGSHGPPSED